MSEQPVAEPVQEVELLSFNRSKDIGKLVSALCKAQLAFDPIYKESENPAFKRGNRVSKYADLFSLVTATRKHLNNNGLTIMQFPTVTVTGKNLNVTTLLAHESGEWISHELLIPATDERGFTAHSIGKAMTYARRYSWQSVTGAVAEDDDDGNEASGVGSHEAGKAVTERKKQEAGERQEAKKSVSTLFYTYPESHNGYMAEWINVSEFAAANEDKADSLRMVFTAHKAKKTAAGGALVPQGEMLPLMEKLAGDLGLTVKELKSASNA